MRLDFSQVEMTPVLGEAPVMTDQRRPLAQLVYQSAGDISGVNLALKIYNAEGPLEFCEEEVALLEKTVSLIAVYWQRMPLENLLSGGADSTV